MKSPKLDAIDTLRGLAALQVIAFHLACMPILRLPTPKWITPWIEHGNSGVSLFFLISAFTLCLSWTARAGETRPYLAFCVRRVFRIVPLFLFWLVWMLWRFRHTPPPLWPDLTANLTFTYNFFPSTCEGIVWASWTLGVEMAFYLCFPFVFAWCRSLPRSVSFFCGTVALSFLARQLITHSGLSPQAASSFYFYSLFRHLPSFAAGMICYHLFRLHLSEKSLPRSKVTCTAALVAAFAIYSWRVTDSFSPTVDVLLEDFVYALVTLALIVFPIELAVNRATRFLGKISYSIYLGHVPVISLIAPIFSSIYAFELSVGLKFTSAYALTALSSIVVATLTYRFVEVPGMAVGKHVLRAIAPVLVNRAASVAKG